MSRSIKKNFIFNLINTVSVLVFPLITFPYASRILLADGMGQVQFYHSIISYIILLTSIGIPLYGIREVARVRDDKEKLSKTTLELFFLSFLFSLVGYIIVAILCLTVGKVQDNIPLFLIISSSIFLTSIGCPWFYSGVEEFKYVTCLNIVVKIASVIFLFIFVKTKADLLLYGVYSVLGSIGNYLVNFIRLRKYISFKGLSLKSLQLFRHVKPAAAVFLLNIITSIYINLDTVMLGFLSGTTAVGYYNGATKLSHLLVTLVTSLGTVLLPRTSNLLENGKNEEFYALSSKSYNFITMMSFPMLCGVLLLSPSIIMLFCGPGFIPSIEVLRIISPIIVFIGISNLIGIQMLYPMGKIKLVTISTGVGAAVNLILNIILIPSMAQNGAALATVIAEFSVMATQVIFARNLIHIPLLSKKTLLYFAASLLMMFICYLVMKVIDKDYLKVIIVPVVGFLAYGGLMVVFRDEMTISILAQLRNKLSRSEG